MTYAEIEEKEKLLAKDPDRQESLTKKINEVILRKGIEDWFKLHAQHTDRINASFRAFLDETTLPPLEVAKVGKFSIMDLTTPSHLRAESDCMGHCVGTSTGYAEKIRK
ncbi:hypothetical protein FACS1894176_00450 [Bacteroidia bacterium]|nr:hypothetical protein FACS1894176_00450 [Bacteroidia bacterium]